MHELGRELDELDVKAAGGVPEPLRRHEHAPWSVGRVAFRFGGNRHVRLAWHGGCLVIGHG